MPFFHVSLNLDISATSKGKGGGSGGRGGGQYVTKSRQNFFCHFHTKCKVVLLVLTSFKFVTISGGKGAHLALYSLLGCT